ncbi:oligopeptidase A [Pseudomonas fluorescens]|uniref:Putative oligopeptidase A n=1 Tax=Pseudomonas fluorescens (strain Pf0-1) TaxID=205922 RepID=Q3KK74_PSEPF|nr:M3 family metallopeptidase [Pseudomonas fluorescens]ABA71832.1 putative oligopeptidase A [Pseudomonas fluorescens Pf0-1]MBY9027658.1 oligopeptidase A [Pseudomonas fluorescens]MBY9033636.1 oligopeptidase A [Pseudomonas fluorescens]MBY9039379.1 oligopeptidase A [Pseudomonas fluorescens]MBY9045301.1 oligopeptidase A [Pseudomonas fluorescens]
MPDTNPLLQHWTLPPWPAIHAEHLLPAVNSIIADNRRIIAQVIASQTEHPGWDDLVLSIDEADARLGEVRSILETLSMVRSDDPVWLVESAKAHLAINQYRSEKAHNRRLYETYQRLAQSSIAGSFDEARNIALSRILRRFKQSGIELPTEQQQELARLNREIGGLEFVFLDNLERWAEAWSKRVDDVALLTGLPPAMKDRLALAARQTGHDGWLIRLDQNTFQHILKYAENRALREECYVAYMTRASDRGPLAGRFDNAPVLKKLLALRQQKARLLGHENAAQLSLAKNSAGTTAWVSGFLQRQAAQLAPTLAQDAEQLTDFAQQRGIDRVQPWDEDFLAEQWRQQQFPGALENLRDYFPLEGTLRRLLLFCERMFGIRIVEQSGGGHLHDDVRLLEISEDEQVIGYIYLDPFHRDGAADFPGTFTLRNRRINAEGRPALPIALLYSNFTPASDTHPCRLELHDLRVLFHEFGHCLQHVLTRSPHHSLSGILQLGHEAAEFSGQLFEQWCLSREFLLWLGAHFQTGKRLSAARVDAALSASQAHSARQQAFLLMGAMIDFELHLTHGDGRSVEETCTDVQRSLGHLQLPDDHRFANGFDYMVTQYDASVYAYVWSGVLAQEAFKRFSQDWVFNAQTGREFRATFFAPGAGRPLLDAVEAFIGRPVAGLVDGEAGRVTSD